MFFDNRTTIGVDLGTTGLRAVEVSRQGGVPTITRWAALDFNGEISDWQTVDPAEIGYMLRSALEEKGIRGYWAAHSVSGDAVAPQYFSFPKLLPEDVPEAVRIEVEAGLPFRAEDALISYVLFPDQRTPVPSVSADEIMNTGLGGEDHPEGGAGGESSKARTHGLAIAADSGMVENRLAVIRRAGLEPFCVESDSTACGNAFVATSQERDDDDSTTAILNIGHRFTTVTHIKNGTILVRDIPVGGRQVTRNAAEQLNITQAEAEKLKRAHWEEGPSAAGPLDEKMREILEPCVRELTDRLQDTIQYWVGEQLVPPVGRMLLTGGGSQIRELPDMLSRMMEVPVEHWSPIPDDGSRKSKHLAPWRYRMSVAFGLALREFPGKGRQ